MQVDEDVVPPSAPARFRNRIIGHGTEAPDQLLANPRNARIHPQAQQDALTGALDTVGWVQSIVVNKRTGFLVDGHLRVQLALRYDEQSVPVVYVDLSDDEERLILATFDAISGLAGRDDDQLRALLGEIGSVQDDGLNALLQSMAHDVALPLTAATGAVAPLYTPEQIVDAAFTYFRAAGFPYRTLAIHECMQELNALCASDNATLERTRLAYQVADTYHPHRFHAHANAKRSPVQSFGIDKSLRKALALQLEAGGSIGRGLVGPMALVNGTQACANFRPGFAALLYRRFCPQGGVVLDTSTGYGGRMLGAIASGVVARYHGIDPNVLTHVSNLKMATDLGFADRVELINAPAEDVQIAPHDAVITSSESLLSAESFDFAFTSPPYFAKEEYSDDDTQSWKRYGHSADAWRAGFLVPMLALQFAALKSGARNVVNIADVKMGETLVPLATWIVDDAIACGFTLERREEFAMAHRMGQGGPDDGEDQVAVEPVFIFAKP